MTNIQLVWLTIQNTFTSCALILPTTSINESHQLIVNIKLLLLLLLEWNWKLSLIRLSFHVIFYSWWLQLQQHLERLTFTSSAAECCKNYTYFPLFFSLVLAVDLIFNKIAFLLLNLQVQHYILVVQAQDNGHPSLSSTLTVYCNVIDLNDNAPVFDPMSYSNEIYENVPIGTEVVRVSATDIDSGECREVD